jgi:CheY-like chemotaxis protein
MTERVVITRSAGSPGRLAGHRILLVEDSMIIALDLEDLLRGQGAIDVAVVDSAAAGLELVAQGAPDAALLDINLGQETSIPLADELLRLGVPYLFMTGYDDHADLTERHQAAPRIAKPIDRELLLEVVERLLRR